MPRKKRRVAAGAARREASPGGARAPLLPWAVARCVAALARGLDVSGARADDLSALEAAARAFVHAYLDRSLVKHLEQDQLWVLLDRRAKDAYARAGRQLEVFAKKAAARDEQPETAQQPSRPASGGGLATEGGEPPERPSVSGGGLAGRGRPDGRSSASEAPPACRWDEGEDFGSMADARLPPPLSPGLGGCQSDETATADSTAAAVVRPLSDDGFSEDMFEGDDVLFAGSDGEDTGDSDSDGGASDGGGGGGGGRGRSDFTDGISDLRHFVETPPGEDGGASDYSDFDGGDGDDGEEGSEGEGFVGNGIGRFDGQGPLRGKPTKGREGPSALALLRERAAELAANPEVRRWEAEILEQRHWTLMGETSASNRDKNELLNVHMELPRFHRPAAAEALPDVLGEDEAEEGDGAAGTGAAGGTPAGLSAEIERLVKMRIRDGLFDDPAPRELAPALQAPQSTDQEPLAGIDTEKSKVSLAEIYAEEYTVATGGRTKRQVAEDDERAKITRLFARIMCKLDQLSNQTVLAKPASTAPTPLLEVKRFDINETVPPIASVV